MNFLWAQPPFFMRMEAKPGKGAPMDCTSFLTPCHGLHQFFVSLPAGWQRGSPCVGNNLFRRPSVVSNNFATYVQRLFVSLHKNSLQPRGLYTLQNSPGQNTGVGSLSLLQGIFPTQRSNPGLPHCRQILYQLSHQGSPFRRPRDLTTGRVMKLMDCASPPI